MYVPAALRYEFVNISATAAVPLSAKTAAAPPPTSTARLFDNQALGVTPTPTCWLPSMVTAVVGVAPVCKTNVPVVSDVTLNPVVVVVDAAIVLMLIP
jgi:hypothetical protein